MRVLARIYNALPTRWQRRILDRANPRFLVGVVGVGVTSDERFLLGRHRFGSSRWRLLGGFLHYDEPLAVGLAREIREETGLEVEVGPLLEASATRGWGHIELIYGYRPVGGAVVLAAEILELRGFAADALPVMRADHLAIVERHAAAVTAWARRRSDPATIAVTP